jgi:hypothetical protein
MGLGSIARARSGTRMGGVHLDCGLIVLGHGGAEDLGVTPVEISRIARLNALSTLIFVSPGTDCRMGMGGKGTV